MLSSRFLIVLRATMPQNMLETLYRKYLLHSFLQSFTNTLFNAFGSLLLYKLTGSILSVLLFLAAGFLTLVLVRSFGANLLLRGISRFGPVMIMGAGLLMIAFSYLGLYYVSATMSYFFVAFIGLSIFKSIGTAFYWTPSNALLFGMTGGSSAPGRSVAYSDIVTIFAGILAVGAGLLLDVHEHFTAIFPFGAIVLMLSIIPLRGIHIASVSIQRISFFDCLKKLRPFTLLSNISIEESLMSIAVPLIALSLFDSFSKPVWINACVVFASSLAAYIAGKCKDTRSRWLSMLAFVAVLVAWVAYGFIGTLAQFITFGVIYAIAAQIISTSRGARLSREVANTGDPLAATMAIEFCRSLGQVF